MLRYLISIIVVIAAGHADAFAMTDSQRADSAYNAQNFRLAAELYQKMADSEEATSDIYYNLGNANYRLGKNAQAILAYERALRLDPSNADAKTNLKFVSDRLQDKKGESGSFLSNTYIQIAEAFTSNGWAILSAVFFALSVGAVALYIFAPSVILKKVGFFGGIIVLLLWISTLALSFKAKSLAERTDMAIITAPSTVLSTVPRTPSSRNEEAMTLHEGTKVQILNSIKTGSDSTAQTWHDVQIDNVHRAWINGADVELIKK